MQDKAEEGGILAVFRPTTTQGCKKLAAEFAAFILWIGSKLFNQITEVIDELQAVQVETEELFISQEPEQKLLRMPDKNKDTN